MCGKLRHVRRAHVPGHVRGLCSDYLQVTVIGAARANYVAVDLRVGPRRYVIQYTFVANYQRIQVLPGSGTVVKCDDDL